MNFALIYVIYYILITLFYWVFLQGFKLIVYLLIIFFYYNFGKESLTNLIFKLKLNYL